jgi:toxin ParE1/3/4
MKRAEFGGVFFRDYLIFYRIQAGQVNVVHILHGAQDYDSFLFSDE